MEVIETVCRRYESAADKGGLSMAKVTINDELCKSCGLCIVACPKKLVAISPDRINTKGFHPVYVTDVDTCIGCAFCAIMCAHVAITVEK
jgi:2-oxoglutarate ferredoxin oxidoreductase subunit delta